MPLYAGVDGAKKEIEALYAGVDGVAKRLESLYASVDGARKELLVVDYYWNKYTVATYNQYEYLVRETVPDQGVYGETWTDVYADPNGYPFSTYGFEPTQNHTEYGHASGSPDESISFTYIKTTTTQGAGVFQEVVVSEDKNAYPSNGIAPDGYWYIRINGGGQPDEPDVPSFEMPIQVDSNLILRQIWAGSQYKKTLRIDSAILGYEAPIQTGNQLAITEVLGVEKNNTQVVIE